MNYNLGLKVSKVSGMTLGAKANLLDLVKSNKNFGTVYRLLDLDQWLSRSAQERVREYSKGRADVVESLAGELFRTSDAARWDLVGVAYYQGRATKSQESNMAKCKTYRQNNGESYRSNNQTRMTVKRSVPTSVQDTPRARKRRR